MKELRTVSPFRLVHLRRLDPKCALLKPRRSLSRSLSKEVVCVQDFITEIDICCDLNHPNLVRLLGYADNPELYMVRTKIPNPHPISSSFIQIEIETISCNS